MRHSTDAWVQELSLRGYHSERYRGHAYDRQRTDETRMQDEAICGLSVLLVSYISIPNHIAFVRPFHLTATEPPIPASNTPIPRMEKEIQSRAVRQTQINSGYGRARLADGGLCAVGSTSAELSRLSIPCEACQ